MGRSEANKNHQPDTKPEISVAWFCVRSQPRHEQIATRHLRQMEGVEVFNPRIRFHRPTRTKAVQVTESLFPNYLFARFDYNVSLSRVHYAPGVSCVVHFGQLWPTIPDQVIEGLKQVHGPEEVREVCPKPGDEVRIAGSALHGLQAVVTQVMPGRERVVVLLDFLGRQTAVEVGLESVVRRGLCRRA